MPSQQKQKDLDIVLSDCFDVGAAGNRLTFTAAANFNDTNVEEIRGSDLIENNPALKARLFDRLERSRFETSIPKNKLTLVLIILQKAMAY